MSTLRFLGKYREFQTLLAKTRKEIEETQTTEELCYTAVYKICFPLHRVTLYDHVKKFILVIRGLMLYDRVQK